MVNLVKNFFSINEQSTNCSNESSSSCLPEMSKNQLPFNKAFLTLALIEPERTVSSSLDELDQFIITKCDLLNGDDERLIKTDFDEKNVHFTEESPNVYSLTSISETSENNSSTLSFSSSPCQNLSLEEFLSSNEMVTCSNFDAWDNPLDPISYSSYESRCSNDLSSESDSESIMSLKSFTSDERLSTVDNEAYRNETPDALSQTELKFPKSILKNKVHQPELLSEPITRRHSEHRNPFLRRDVKSLSHLDCYLKPTVQRQKKFSVPARLPLKTLKITLKANIKFLNSLKQANDCSEELISLLIKQAERLNGDIKIILLYNAIKYSGFAVFGIFLSWTAVGYLAKLIKNR